MITLGSYSAHFAGSNEVLHMIVTFFGVFQKFLTDCYASTAQLFKWCKTIHLKQVNNAKLIGNHENRVFYAAIVN